MLNVIDLRKKHSLPFDLKKRFELNRDDIKTAVEKIVADIRSRGDQALLEYERLFDKVELTAEGLKVKHVEIEDAYHKVEKRFIEVIRKAAQNIRLFHQKQMKNSWIMHEPEGIVVGQIYKPLECVGIYVPGGRAAYPSSVLMNAIPAQVAGVERIVMATPPMADGNVSPYTLVAAKEAGVHEVYRIGGAQAIASMAFGTANIPKVDKIVGPGNIYVAMAKRIVFGYVGVDMVAGPSEILVIADESADPRFVAADLLSQSEHDPMASAILITAHENLAYNVMDEIVRQCRLLPRKEIIERALSDFGYIIIVEDLKKAIDLSNEIAPEHMELMVRQPFDVLGMVKNAGAVFLGSYSPEPLGDYMAGPNHVLPTGGTARFYSPLGVEDFVKRSSLIYYTKDALNTLQQDIVDLAYFEGLTAHANSIKMRFEDND